MGGRSRADYDATVSKKYRRQAPRTENFLEDRHLRGNARQTLVATGRDQLRNFPLAGWALRRHLDYCTGHVLQIYTGDDEYNDALEARFRAWAEPPDVYDVAGRHGHTDAMRLIEAAAFTAGDHFIVLRADGRVQHIESDRVRDPMDIPAGWIVVDGVHLDTDGRPLHYAVHSRGPDGTDYLFEDWIDARHVIHYGYFQRFDQVRGIAQTAATQNTGQDLHEAHEGMLLNLKLRNAFLMTVNREPVEGPKRPAMFGGAGGAGGDGDAGMTDEDAAYENARRKINPLKGPAKMEMRPGESVTFHEAKTPSMEAQQYTERLTHFLAHPAGAVMRRPRPPRHQTRKVH